MRRSSRTSFRSARRSTGRSSKLRPNGQQVKQGDLLFRIDPAPYRVALEQAQAQLAAAQLQTSRTADSGGGHRRRHHRVAGRLADQAARAGPPGGAAEAGLHHPVRLTTTRRRSAHGGNRSRQRAGAGRQCRAPRSRPASSPAIAAAGRRSTRRGSTSRGPKCARRWTDGRERRQAPGRPDGGDRRRHAVAGPQQGRLGRGQFQGKGRRPDGSRAKRPRSSVDAYPGVDFKAHVQSIGAGTGSEFSLLPAQNANGNWVKVTQRVPVRIAFDGHARPSR